MLHPANKQFQFTQREREIMRAYATRIQERIKETRLEINRMERQPQGSPAGVIDTIEAELKQVAKHLETIGDQKIQMTPAMVFWFADLMENDISIMNGIPDSSFTHIPRRDVPVLNTASATVYELLQLHFKLGTSLIRKEGVEALDRMHTARSEDKE